MQNKDYGDVFFYIDLMSVKKTVIRNEPVTKMAPYVTEERVKRTEREGIQGKGEGKKSL